MALPHPKIERTLAPAVPMIMTFNASALREALNAAGANIPPGADITVRIPGGGDYSNMDLELDNQNVVLDIRWKA